MRVRALIQVIRNPTLTPTPLPKGEGSILPTLREKRSLDAGKRPSSMHEEWRCCRIEALAKYAQ
jgi:hypothetical protein